MIKVKSFVILLLFIGAVIGVFLSFGTYYGLQITSGEKFCVLCHEMDPMVMAYKDDVHGGKGKIGASARCIDCHLPHDSLVNYIYTKAKNGLVEGYGHFFKDTNEINWQENRKHREKYVYDTACLKCHGNILKADLSTSSKQAKKMHLHYKNLKGTQKQIKCASCHFDAGHKNLRTYLNYYKPEYSLYKEKLEEKKLELQKKYEKYGIEKSINTK